MKREIKFRAWDGNKMYLPEYEDKEDFHILADGTIVETHEYGYDRHQLTSRRGPEWLLMQFTGLKDKNGVDIYEGDIVKCGYGTAEVYFMLGAWCVRWVDDREAEGEFLGFNKKVRRAREDNEQFEVIGNIHQNPDLLK